MIRGYEEREARGPQLSSTGFPQGIGEHAVKPRLCGTTRNAALAASGVSTFCRAGLTSGEDAVDSLSADKIGICPSPVVKPAAALTRVKPQWSSYPRIRSVFVLRPGQGRPAENLETPATLPECDSKKASAPTSRSHRPEPVRHLPLAGQSSDTSPVSGAECNLRRSFRRHGPPARSSSLRPHLPQAAGS